MNNQEFFEHWINFTDFLIEIEEVKLKLFRAIHNNLDKKEIQEIIDWPGKRITDFFDDAGYCDLCEKVYRYFIDQDINCSSTLCELYQFVSDVCLFWAKNEKEHQIKIKQNKIEQLQKQLDQLKREAQ